MPAPEGYKTVRNSVTGEEEIVPRAEGWNLTRNDRLKLWELSNKKEIQQMIYAQSQLPPELRDYSGLNFTKQGGVQPPDRPGYNPLSLDVFSTGSYASGAYLKNQQNKRLGINERVGIKEAIYPSEVLVPEGASTAESERWKRATKYNPVYQVLPVWGKKIYTDIAFDPTSYVTSGIGGATKFVTSGRKTIGLTGKGVEAYAQLLKRYPRIKTVSETGQELLHINPEVRHIMSKMLRENPGMIQKEGLRFIYSNIELIPRRLLPWSYVGSIASKTGSKVNELYVGLKERIRNIEVKSSISENRIITGLTNIGKKDYQQDITGWGIRRGVRIQSTIAQRTKEALSELKELEREAKNIYGNDAGKLLSDYLENPNARPLMPRLKPIAERIQKIHADMVIEEQRLGLLADTKTNYVRHLVTNQYKYLKGLIGKPDVKSGLYALHRDVDKTIMDANAEAMKKYGVNMFNPDAFKATAFRIREDIATVETAKYLQFLKNTYGKSKKEARMLRGWTESKFLPQLKGVYLPTDLLKSLEDDVVVQRIMQTQGKEGMSRFGKLALNAYDSYNNFWRRMQTIPFPEFHMRNIYGSMYKNIMANVNPLTWAKVKATKSVGDDVIIVSRTGIKYTKSEVERIGREVGIYDQVGPAGETVGDVIGTKYTEQGIFKPFMQVGAGIEKRVREMMLFDSLENGDDIATISGKINNYHFDYRKQYSEIEEDIFKRIIPFYVWFRENKLNELYMMATTPGKYSVIDKLMGSNKNATNQVEESYMPDYLKGGAIVPIGGNNTWIGTGMPFEDITKLPNQMAKGTEGFAGTNIFPILQAPYEAYTGRQMYTGQNITNWGEWMVSKSPFSRLKNTLDLIENENKTPMQKALKLGLGINVYNATDWIWSVRSTPEGIVRQSIRRLGGKYHGCGF